MSAAVRVAGLVALALSCAATRGDAASTRNYRWPPERLPVTYHVDAVHDVPSIAGNGEHLEVEAAFQEWDSLPNVAITFRRGADLTAADPAVNGPAVGDGITSVVFEDPASMVPNGTLAITPFDYYPDRFTSDSHPFANFFGAFDLDIIVNNGIAFYADGAPCNGGYHLRSVLTREVGYLMGLGFSTDPEATMHNSLTPCDEEAASLSADDIGGAEIVSPIAAVGHAMSLDDTLAAACTDRDGFLDSGESGRLGVLVRNNFHRPLTGLTARLVNVPGGFDPRDSAVTVDSAPVLALGDLAVGATTRASWDLSLATSTIPGSTSFVIELDGSTVEGPFTNNQYLRLDLQVDPIHDSVNDTAMLEGAVGIGWASFDIRPVVSPGFASPDEWRRQTEACAGPADWWRVIPPTSTAPCTDPYRDRDALLLGGPNVRMGIGDNLYFPVLDSARVRARVAMGPGDFARVLGDSTGLGELTTLVADLSTAVEPVFRDLVFDLRGLDWAARPMFSGSGPILSFYLRSEAPVAGDLGLWVDEVELTWLSDLEPDRTSCGTTLFRVRRGPDPSVVPLPIHALDVTFPWRDPGALVDGVPLHCYSAEGPTPLDIRLSKSNLDVLIETR